MNTVTAQGHDGYPPPLQEHGCDQECTQGPVQGGLPGAWVRPVDRPSQGTSCDHVWYGHSTWRYARGAAPTTATDDVECERPKSLVCVLCGEVRRVRCKSTKSSRCVPCSERHRRAIARVIRNGTAKAIGSTSFVTLTAPGVDVLPWDRSRCSHGPEVGCSGSIGCRVDTAAAAEWNATAPKRWSYFRQYLERWFGLEVAVIGSWETQERGALHRHAVVRFNGVVGEKRLRVAVRSFSARYGFGSRVAKDAVQIITDPKRAAYYIAKYATKSADARPVTPFLDRCSGDMFAGRYRSWSSSRNWGVTIASVWAAQRAWALGGGVAGASAPNAGAHAGAVGAGLDLNAESSTGGGLIPWVPASAVLS